MVEMESRFDVGRNFDAVVGLGKVLNVAGLKSGSRSIAYFPDSRLRKATHSVYIEAVEVSPDLRGKYFLSF